MEQSNGFNNVLNGILVFFFTVAIGLSTYKMMAIAFPYLVPPFPTDIDFLKSKQWVVDEWHWMTAFYIHITSAALVLAAGLTQFSKYLMFQKAALHRRIGKAYVLLILLVACPSGFIMAFYGNGGWAARYAFILQALAWWFLTYMAYQTIRKGQLEAHAKYMIRSYAMTLSAISLRGATYILSEWKMSNGIQCLGDAHFLLCYPDFYILVAWLSWIVNLVIAEVLIACGITQYYLGKKNVAEST